MGLILFLLLFLSLGMSIFSIVYSLGIAAMIIQSILVIISVLALKRRIKKRRSFIGVTLVTILHTGFLIVICYIFITIAIPYKEDGDSKEVLLGIQKYMYSNWGIFQPEEEINEPPIENNFDAGVEDPPEWK